MSRLVRITLSLALAAAALGLAVISGAGGALSAPTRSAGPARSDASGKPGPRGPAGPRGPQGPAGPSEAVATFKDGPVALSVGTSSKVTSLSIPRTGSYVVTAKAITGAPAQFAGLVTCQLDAHGDQDMSRSLAEPTIALALSLEVVHTFAAPGTVDLNCSVGSVLGATAGGLLSWIKIVAIRVGKLTNTPG